MLPRLTVENWRELSDRARSEATPLVIDAAFEDSKAVRSWTPRTLADRFRGMQVNVAVDLPENRAPYLDAHRPHGGSMAFEELVARVETGERCYLNQASLERFGDLVAEIDLASISAPPIYAVNMWLGGQTRSGLHYDAADNLVVQIFGTKTATLVAPKYARHLRLMPDNPSKSRLSPSEIEGTTDGTLPDMPRWRGALSPGDALFIPRGWWHYIASGGVSISLNVWHGDRLEFKDYFAGFVRSGPRVWGRTARDFTWCGVLGREYEQRLFSPPPLGVSLHERMRRRRAPTRS
jgi:hypothetical protein